MNSNVFAKYVIYHVIDLVKLKLMDVMVVDVKFLLSMELSHHLEDRISVVAELIL
jgi:hypothetical protein